MALNDVFVSTINDIFVSTVDDIWFGIEVESIDVVVKALAARVFYFTLTGAPDGKDDVEIPISSFQGRRRNGTPTYLSAVTHDLTYADAIADRPNGEIYVEMAYILEGAETDREEIIRGSLDTVVYDEGAKSSAITLSGYKTESWIGTSRTLSGAVYKRTTSTGFNYRFSDVDVFVRPGDSVTVGDDTYIPAVINYSISATTNGVNAQMEVTDIVG